MPRILGLDLGDARIGIAVSDQLCITAQAKEVYERKSIAKDKEKIKSVVEQYEVNAVVIGLPKNMNGTPSRQSGKVVKFSEILKSYLNLPIITWDERLTTKIAERTLIEANVTRKKRKMITDKVAAQVILQGYLDYLANTR